MTQSYRILVVDDDLSLGMAITRMLSKIGCECTHAKDGCEALSFFENTAFDMVILDVMMPKIDGFDVCRTIRATDAHIPILFLTAKSDIGDKRTGFQTGADDWLVKPFYGEELQMRVTALLRRAQEGASSQREKERVFSVGELWVDLVEREVRISGRKVDLTPKEARIVVLLAEHPGEIFGKEDLISAIWGDEYLGTAISISAYIRRIRAKLESDPSAPQYIQTVWNRGYRMRVPQVDGAGSA